MSDNAIRRFSGPFSFLSNMHPVSVDYQGVTWPSVEHAYQAAKTSDPGARQRILAARTPGDAKRLGRAVKLEDWSEDRRIAIMGELHRKKFSIVGGAENERLYYLLLGTGDYWLEEGNNWGDRFWGTVNGEGENYQGASLMAVREDLRRTIQGQIRRPIQVKKMEQWELDKLRALERRMKHEPRFSPEIQRQMRELPLYIGRPSLWGNPYTHQDGTAADYKVESRTAAIAAYEEHVLGNTTLLAMLPVMRNHVLGCWCKPLDCHGDVIARMAEGRLSWSLERRVGRYRGA